MWSGKFVTHLQFDWPSLHCGSAMSMLKMVRVHSTSSAWKRHITMLMCACCTAAAAAAAAAASLLQSLYGAQTLSVPGSYEKVEEGVLPW
jgi:hypothetical protein